jgi:hypothetical protein
MECRPDGCRFVLTNKERRRLAGERASDERALGQGSGSRARGPGGAGRGAMRSRRGRGRCRRNATAAPTPLSIHLGLTQNEMARTHRFREVAFFEVNGSREHSPVSIAETQIHFSTKPSAGPAAIARPCPSIAGAVAGSLRNSSEHAAAQRLIAAGLLEDDDGVLRPTQRAPKRRFRQPLTAAISADPASIPHAWQ